MARINGSFSYILLIAFLILFRANSITAQEVDDEREFEYSENSEKGPSKWGHIKQEWAACSTGKMQSPIDMSNERVSLISRPERGEYKPTNATVKNRGHDIQIEWFGDAGSIAINGTEFPLRYAHWHSPSEHSINGRKYDVELHMVHINKDPNAKIAVLGTLYRIGNPDPFLSKLMGEIASMIDKKDEKQQLGVVDPKEIETTSKRYYRYMGSLTTPPCTEGVIWTLNKRVKTISSGQVSLLRQAVHDYAEKNARPVQPKNSRDVYLYGPTN